LLSRYLVEDNNDSYVTVDFFAMSEALRVKSIFRNLMKDYEIFRDKTKSENELRTFILAQK